MVAVSIAGPNVFDGLPDDGRYLFGFTPFLPDPDAPPPLFSSIWETSFVDGASHWIRTSPDDTLGFVGVIGEYGVDFFMLLPTDGLAAYPHIGSLGPAEVTTSSGQGP